MMKQKTKTCLLSVFKYVGLVILASIIGYFLLAGIYKFSNFYAINKHVYDSEVLFEREGDYPSNFTDDSVLDNSTDRIMINIIEYDGTYSPFKSAASAPRKVADEKCLYHNWRKYEAERNHEEMCLNDVSYVRYWHGYQVFLRPLFRFFNFQQIRDILAFTYLALIVGISVLMAKKNLSIYIAPLIVAIVSMNFTSLTMSLQYSTTTLTTLLAIVIMLFVNTRKTLRIDSKFYRYLFLLLGCMVNYVDLLTFPVFSVGMLSIFYVLSNRDEDYKTIFKNLCINITLWCLGYGLMWVMRWTISSIVLQQNCFTSALDAASIRLQTSSGQDKYTILETLSLQFNRISKFSYAINILCVVINIVINIFIKKNRKLSIKSVVPFILIALMPLVWYIVLRNHSFIHNSMTFRGLGVFFMAVHCIVINLFVKTTWK